MVSYKSVPSRQLETNKPFRADYTAVMFSVSAQLLETDKPIGLGHKAVRDLGENRQGRRPKIWCPVVKEAPGRIWGTQEQAPRAVPWVSRTSLFV